jgi:hypothetical protein
MGGAAGSTLVEMAKEKNATAMFLGETGKCVEQGKDFPGLMEIDAGTKEAVEWIEDQEAGLSSLERVFQNAGRGDASAQYDETGGISVELGEARVNDSRAIVLRGGVQDGARFEFFAGEGGSSAAQRGRDRQRDPGLSRSRLAGDHGQGAGGEPVLPEPFDGAEWKVREIDDVGAVFRGRWISG